jgi:hypothetical protein
VSLTLPDTPKGVTNDPRVVRIDPQGGADGENFLLDDGTAPSPTQGFPAWTEQARQGRRSALYFDGAGAWGQDVPVLLEAWKGGPRIAKVRRQVEVLRQLYETPHVGSPPLLATLTGLALWRQGKDWALVSITQSERVHASGDDINRGVTKGDLLRLRLVLSFRQRLVADALLLNHAPIPGYRLHVVKKGETLRTIAVAELGSEKRWREIRYANGDAIKDPAKIKWKDRLRIPPKGSA